MSSTTGATLPGSGTTLAGVSGCETTTNWTASDKITADDTLRATRTSIAVGAHTKRLAAYNFGFAIPTGSTIVGIMATVERSTGSASYDIYDKSAVLYKNDGASGFLIVGDDKKKDTTKWPTNDGAVYYGGSTDDWNAGLTAADINDSRFGFGISAVNSGSAVANARVDYIKITVLYQLEGSGAVDAVTGIIVAGAGSVPMSPEGSGSASVTVEADGDANFSYSTAAATLTIDQPTSAGTGNFKYVGTGYRSFGYDTIGKVTASGIAHGPGTSGYGFPEVETITTAGTGNVVRSGTGSAEITVTCSGVANQVVDGNFPDTDHYSHGVKPVLASGIGQIVFNSTNAVHVTAATAIGFGKTLTEEADLRLRTEYRCIAYLERLTEAILTDSDGNIFSDDVSTVNPIDYEDGISSILIVDDYPTNEIIASWETLTDRRLWDSALDSGWTPTWTSDALVASALISMGQEDFTSPVPQSSFTLEIQNTDNSFSTDRLHGRTVAIEHIATDFYQDGTSADRITRMAYTVDDWQKKPGVISLNLTDLLSTILDSEYPARQYEKNAHFPALLEESVNTAIPYVVGRGTKCLATYIKARSLGDETLDNGNFTAGKTNWILYGTGYWVIELGRAVKRVDGRCNLTTNIPLSVSTYYCAHFLYECSAGSLQVAVLNVLSGDTFDSTYDGINAEESGEMYKWATAILKTAESVTSSLGFAFVPSYDFRGGIGYAELIELQAPSDNLIRNGGFDDNSYWTLGIGWTIENGYAYKTAGNTNTLSQVPGDVTIARNQAWHISLEIYISAGTLQVSFNSQNYFRLLDNNDAGVISCDFFLEDVTNANDGLVFTPSSDFAGSIDNVYAYYHKLATTSTGYHAPLASSDIGLQGCDGVSWTDVAYIIDSGDDLRAVRTAIAPGDFTRRLRAYNFNFSVPTEDEIVGIVVKVDRSTGNDVYEIEDYRATLLKSASTIYGCAQAGENKAKTTLQWSTGDNTVYYGASDDTWEAELTATDINNVQFGFALSVRNTGESAADARVDFINIAVIYITKVILNDNPAFTSSYGWTVGSDAAWSIGGNQARKLPGSAHSLKPIVLTITAGETYEIAWDYTCQSGNVTAEFGGEELGRSLSATSGSEVWQVTASTTETLEFIPNPLLNGTLDNISVKVVNPNIYAVCEAPDNSQFTVQTVYKMTSSGVTILPTDQYRAGTYDAGDYNLHTLEFPTNPVDFSGSSAVIVADVTRLDKDAITGLVDPLDYEGINVVTEIARLLKQAGFRTNAASQYVAEQHAEKLGLRVDWAYGGTGQGLALRGILDQLLTVMRGVIWRDAGGRWSFWVDDDHSADYSLNEDYGDLVQMDQYQVLAYPKTVKVHYRPGRENNETQFTLQRDYYYGKEGELELVLPCVYSFALADKLCAYYRQLFRYGVMLRGSITGREVRIGDVIAITNTPLGLSASPFMVLQAVTHYDVTEVVLRGYDERILQYVRGKSPTGGDAYNPDYTQVMPLAPTNLIMTHFGVNAARNTAYVECACTPPAVNCHEVWFILEKNVNRIQQRFLGESVGDVWRIALDELEQGAFYTLSAYAVNVYGVYGYLSESLLFRASG